MASKKVTTRDVAELAEVSLSAVSLYLNNRVGLSDKTRQRIQHAIHQLQYVPRSTLNTVPVAATFIGLLVERLPMSPFMDMFYGDVIQGLELRARALGYNLALMTVESHNLSELLDQHHGLLAGLVILGGGALNTQTVEGLLAEGLPSVLVDNVIADHAVHCVLPDYLQGAYSATRYLLEKGCRRVGFIQGSPKYQSLIERYHGYALAMLDAGIAVDATLVQPSVSSGLPNKGYHEMKVLLARTPNLDAVFCVTDRTALGALEALRELGVRVPTDLRLLSFDNVTQASYTNPPLTTVDVPKREMGAITMNLLHQMITLPGTMPPIKLLIPSQLIVRESA